MRPSHSNHARHVLRALRTAQQHLQDLATERWTAVDPTDREARKQVVVFMEACDEQAEAIQAVADALGTLFRETPGLSLDAPDPDTSHADTSHDAQTNTRTVQPLDTREPHTLEENFTHKRPYGFTLLGTAYHDLRTWTDLYEQVCTVLGHHDAEWFALLPEMERFHTKRGNQHFANDPKQLREPRDIGHGVYAETHFSANTLRDRMRELLDAFELSPDALTIYLREDRDA